MIQRRPNRRGDDQRIVETAEAPWWSLAPGTYYAYSGRQAVWSSIIHANRGVADFPQNNDVAGGHSLIGVDSQTATCLQQFQAAERQSCSYDLKIRALVPVINTQSYVWNFSNEPLMRLTIRIRCLKPTMGHAYILCGHRVECDGYH